MTLTATKPASPPAKAGAMAQSTALAGRSEKALDTAIDAIDEALAATGNPNDPDTISRIAQARALYRACVNAPANLSWGENASSETKGRLLMFCLRNRLDPNSGHVFILGGRLYTALEGRLSIANSHRDDEGKRTFAGFAVDEPMPSELRAALSIPDGTIAWVAEAERADCKYRFKGIGLAGGVDEKNPIAKTLTGALAMAQKRAKERALKLAYPIGGEPEDDGPIINLRPGDYSVTNPGGAAPFEPQQIAANGGDPEREAVKQELRGLYTQHNAIFVRVLKDRGLALTDLAGMAIADGREIAAQVRAAAADPRLGELRGKLARLRVEKSDAFRDVHERAGKPDLDGLATEMLDAFVKDVEAAASGAAA